MHAINICVTYRTFPEARKETIPLLKKAKASKCDGLQPINILPPICKVFEKVFYLQIRNRLNK